jgi:SAM-dependent methyltransferase
MNPSWYDRHILPHALDFACGLPMISRQRQLVVPLAQGRVLEVGIGTGLNMPWYDKTRVTHITGLDPALQLHALARERIAQAGLEVELLGLSAEQIPLPDASFDTVLITYTLCTIPDPLAALRLQPLWGKVAGGCHLGRDIPALLQEAGFRLSDLHTRYLPGPRPFTFHYWGEALPV